MLTVQRLAASVVVVGIFGGVLGGCSTWNKMWGKGESNEKEERTSMTALPEPVRTSFNRDYPNANVSDVERETEKDGAIHYEIKFTDQSGRKQEVEYDGSGSRAHEDEK
jgi:YD repeat-containing protein